MNIRRIIAAILSVVFLTALTLGSAGTAFADPKEGGKASCMAYEAAGVSPPGSNLDEPGMPWVIEFVRTEFLEGAKGIGPVVKTLAQLHLGSHEACEG